MISRCLSFTSFHPVAAQGLALLSSTALPTGHCSFHPSLLFLRSLHARIFFSDSSMTCKPPLQNFAVIHVFTYTAAFLHLRDEPLNCLCSYLRRCLSFRVLCNIIEPCSQILYISILVFDSEPTVDRVSHVSGFHGSRLRPSPQATFLCFGAFRCQDLLFVLLLRFRFCTSLLFFDLKGQLFQSLLNFFVTCLLPSYMLHSFVLLDAWPACGPLALSSESPRNHLAKLCFHILSFFTRTAVSSDVPFVFLIAVLCLPYFF